MPIVVFIVQNLDSKKAKKGAKKVRLPSRSPARVASHDIFYEASSSLAEILFSSQDFASLARATCGLQWWA
jgi:hypothetical protein